MGGKVGSENHIVDPLRANYSRHKQNRQTYLDRLNLTNNRRIETWQNRPKTADKLHTRLFANTIMAKLTNHFQRTRLITSSTDEKYSLGSEKKNVVQMLLFMVVNALSYTQLVHRHATLNEGNKYEDDLRTGCRNVSHQQEFLSEVTSPGRSHKTNQNLVCKHIRLTQTPVYPQRLKSKMADILKLCCHLPEV